MQVKNINELDYINYKKPSMFIATCYCDWKCCNDASVDNSMCQNAPIAKQKNIDISTDEIFSRYISNPLSKAIVFGGLEPILQFDEIIEVVKYFREHKCNDDIVIYTGYYKNEIKEQLNKLKKYPNIIIKFGRFIPNQKSHFDKILGVNLASKNQYGERIS